MSATPQISPPTSESAQNTAFASRGERLSAALLACGCLSVLLIGAWLRPSPLGTGTHEQLGLPACGMLIATGIPCPSCGMTTAVTHAAHGSVFASLRTQPFGLLFALAAAVGFWGGLHVAIFATRVTPLAAKLFRPSLAWVVAAAWALGWLYKVIVWTG